MVMYRVGLIGAGRKGTQHALAYMVDNRTEVVAVADTDPENLELFHERTGIAAYADYREMLEKERIDIAAPILPVSANPDVVITCAESGIRAILCEKPVSTSLSEVDHMISVCNNRGVVFGAGGGFLFYANRVGRKFDGVTPRAAEVAGYFHKVYPAFADVGIASHWTGPIDRSLSGLPFFGRLGGRADILYGLGFSGNGVGPTMLGGKILASLVLEARDEWSECGLVRDGAGKFPREPMRYVGGTMVMAAKRRIETLDDQGRKPGIITRAIANLAPAGLVPVKGFNADQPSSGASG